jgi:hypothetical protein
VQRKQVKVRFSPEQETRDAEDDDESGSQQVSRQIRL